MTTYTSRVDRIANALQQQVSAGKLRAGERLPAERSLCVTYGVGRTTIREALKTLVARGIIGRQGRNSVIADAQNILPAGTDLAGLAAQVNIKQLYEVRKLIEMQIAGWAATRASGKEIKALRRILETAGASNGASPHRAFHGALVQAAHNPVLGQIYQSGSQIFFRLPFFWNLLEDSEVKTVRARRHEMARRWHEQILQAIEEHDAAEAQGAMFQHLDIMEKDLLARLHQRDGYPAATRDRQHSHPLLDNIQLARKEISRTQRASR